MQNYIINLIYMLGKLKNMFLLFHFLKQQMLRISFLLAGR